MEQLSADIFLNRWNRNCSANKKKLIRTHYTFFKVMLQWNWIQSLLQCTAPHSDKTIESPLITKNVYKTFLHNSVHRNRSQIFTACAKHCLCFAVMLFMIQEESYDWLLHIKSSPITSNLFHLYIILGKCRICNIYYRNSGGNSDRALNATRIITDYSQKDQWLQAATKLFSLAKTRNREPTVAFQPDIHYPMHDYTNLST